MAVHDFFTVELWTNVTPAGAFAELKRVCGEVCENDSAGVPGPDDFLWRIVTAPRRGSIRRAIPWLAKSSGTGKQNHPAGGGELSSERRSPVSGTPWRLVELLLSRGCGMNEFDYLDIVGSRVFHALHFPRATEFCRSALMSPRACRA